MDYSTPGFPVPLSLWVYSNSRPLSWWCHPTISSSVIPFKIGSSFQRLQVKTDLQSCSWSICQGGEFTSTVEPKWPPTTSWNQDQRGRVSCPGTSGGYLFSLLTPFSKWASWKPANQKLSHQSIWVPARPPKSKKCDQTATGETDLSPASRLLAGQLLHQFSSVQPLSRVWLFATPWMAARQASLSIANPQSLLKLMSIELVMSSNCLILCHPLLLLPSIFPSVRVFSNESALPIRWPKYWSFSFNISPSNEHSGLISFRKPLNKAVSFLKLEL